jgi:hypothetical protein
MKKSFTPDEINARLAATRDQKFRHKSEKQIDSFIRSSGLAKERWSNNSWREETMKTFNSTKFKKKISSLGKKSHKEQDSASKKARMEKVFATRVKKGHYLSKETWKEIYEQVWGPDRWDKNLHSRLAEKYGITITTLQTCMTGGAMVPDKADYKKRLLIWEKKYGRRSHTFTAISPTGKQYKFETQVDLGKWAIGKWGFSNMPSCLGGSLCRDGKVKQRGQLKGWQFLKK